MHPILSHIHPALRTATLAWLLSRAIFIAMAGLGAQSPWMRFELQDAAHTIGWSVLLRLLMGVDAILPQTVWGMKASVLGLNLLAQLVLWMGALAVYHLSRRDTLPQTAERSTWLWMLCPLWVLGAHVPSWIFAISLAMVAMALVERARYLPALLVLGLAVSMRIDAIIIAPAFGWLAFKSYAPGRAHPSMPWVAALGAHALLPLSIFSAMLLGGKLGVSLRTLHPQPLAQHLPILTTPSVWMLCPVLLVLSVPLLLRYRGQYPAFWTALALPALFWPMAFGSPQWMLPTLLLAFPLFALMGKALDDPARERVVMALSVLGAMICTMALRA